MHVRTVSHQFSLEHVPENTEYCQRKNDFTNSDFTEKYSSVCFQSNALWRPLLNNVFNGNEQPRNSAQVKYIPLTRVIPRTQNFDRPRVFVPLTMHADTLCLIHSLLLTSCFEFVQICLQADIQYAIKFIYHPKSFQGTRDS